jgi:putative hydrolase of the HAD superfamily
VVSKSFRVLGVPLLLIDLDGTLVDWTEAYARWATSFAAARGADRSDVDWLLAADGKYASRAELASAVAARFHLGAQEETDLVGNLGEDLISYLRADDEVLDALSDARKADWVPFVVTNGAVSRQERKLRGTGLDRQVAGWVISEGAGIAKPDRAIFELAAASAGVPLDGAWMIGDSADADIAGARNAGIASIWLAHGRDWPYTSFAPTRIAASLPEAIRYVLTTVR